MSNRLAASGRHHQRLRKIDHLVSVLMAMGLGYMIRPSLGTWAALVAPLLLGVGAAVKIALFELSRKHGIGAEQAA